MKRMIGGVVVLLLLGMLSTGCSLFKKPAEAEPEEAIPATVRVTNQDWMDITVYVVRSSRRFRLGRVSTGNTEVFEVPVSIMAGATALHFLAVPLASRDDRITQELVVYPGDEVTLVNGQNRWTHVGLASR